jgi:diguanylate cyclase (GGDEF)-like protein/PAS domain S-box-containing protein
LQATQSLRARLLLLLLLAVLPPSGLLISTTVNDLNNAQAEVANDALRLARQIESYPISIIPDPRYFLENLSKHPAILETDPPDSCNRLLTSLLEVHRYFGNIGVIGLDGEVLCSGAPTDKSVNLRDRSYFRRALESKGFAIGEYLVGRITGKAGVPFSSPVFDARGQPRAVVYVVLNLSWLSQAVARTNLPAGSKVTVLDSQGTILAGYADAEAQIGKPIPELSAYRVFQRQQSEGMVESVGLDNVTRINAYVPIYTSPGANIYLRVGVPKEIAYAKVKDKIIRTTLLLGLMAFTVLAVAWYGGDWLILRRVNALTKAATRMGQGDLDARTGLPHSREEIGQLARAFDEMAEGLQRSHRALRALTAASRTLVHATEERQLLQDMCQIVAEVGKYPLAYIGFAENDAAKTMSIAASAGGAKAYVENLSLSWDENSPVGRGPTGICVRENKTVVSHETASDPTLAQWRKRAAEFRLGSQIVLPLGTGSKVFGVLTIFAKTTDAFDEEEQSLLGELAGDLAYGITSLKSQGAREQAEAAQQAAEEKLIGILNSIDQVVWSISASAFELLYLNPAAEKVYGRLVTDFYHNPDLWLEIVHPEDRNLVRGMLPELRRHGVMTIEYRIIRADGEERWLEDHARTIYDAAGNLIRYDGVATDITERKKHERQIEKLATHDSLTELPNRNLLTDRLIQAINHAKRTELGLALLFVDLDRFKFVNDSYGHPVGDALLKVVARELHRLVRKSDTVARLGGDEFVILLTDLKKPSFDASRVASKVLSRFSLPLAVDDLELTITASVGISLYPEDGQDLDALLKNADVAMYRSKELGRNSFQFYRAEMREKVMERISLEGSLRRALELEQFELHYQPQVVISTGKIIGMEALIRWRHPEMGMISPAKFIPIAEDTGLIVPIGDWVLRTACAQNKAWQKAGLPCLPVSVNLSARQLETEGLVASLARVLNETGLESKYLELELTESMVMGRLDTMISLLKELKGIGVMLSMDDFGTGYSNLGNLRSFPLNKLKIDQSFVRNITTNPHDVAVAQMIIALGHSLSLNVIAEGVETEAQSRLLELFRCDCAQGYFFSRPVPAVELAAMLREGKMLKIGGG